MKAFLKKKISDKKGFTLAELLVVVAIIAILVAISIPIFTAQLEKAREATDLANIRSAYAEASTKALDDNGSDVGEATTDEAMKSDNWAQQSDSASIGGVKVKDNISKTKGQYIKVTVQEGKDPVFTSTATKSAKTN